VTWKRDSIARRSLDPGDLGFLIPIPQRGQSPVSPFTSRYRELRWLGPALTGTGWQARTNNGFGVTAKLTEFTYGN
jgi:hypothetical protein